MDNSTTVELPTEEDEDDIEMTEVLANGTPKSKRSGVWHFFMKTMEKNEKGFPLAKCRLCAEVPVMIACTNTSNMRKHLTRHHRSEYIVDVVSGQKVMHIAVI